MKLSDQVCSLELAKRLQEIGMPQKSLFVWEYVNEKCYGVRYSPFAVVPYEGCDFRLYSAFTASELFEIIPYAIDMKKDEPFNNFRFDMTIFNLVEKVEDDDSLVLKKHYSINYHCDTHDPSDFPAFPRKLFEKNIHDENLADAAAKVIIRLYEDWGMKFD